MWAACIDRSGGPMAADSLNPLSNIRASHIYYGQVILIPAQSAVQR